MIKKSTFSANISAKSIDTVDSIDIMKVANTQKKNTFSNSIDTVDSKCVVTQNVTNHEPISVTEKVVRGREGEEIQS